MRLRHSALLLSAVAATLPLVEAWAAVTQTVTATACSASGCSADIRNAIIQLTPGGTLYLHGTFNLTEPIELKSNITVDGRGSATLRMAAMGAYLDFFTKPSNDPLNDVTIQGIYADGTRGTPPWTAGELVRGFLYVDLTSGSSEVKNLTIRDCVMGNFDRSAIALLSSGSGSLAIHNIKLERLTIRNTFQSHGILLQTPNQAYSDSQKYGPVVIKNNFLHDLGTIGTPFGGFGILLSGFEGVFIEGNRVDRTCEEAIRVINSHNVSITGNASTGVYGACTDAGGIKSNASWNVTIAGNTIYDKKKPLIEVLGGLDVTVANNTLTKGKESGIMVRTDGNTFIPRIERVTITGNTIYDVTHAIHVQAYDLAANDPFAHYITVSGNVADRVCKGFRSEKDAASTEYVRHVAITGNIFRANGMATPPGPGYCLTSADWLAVSVQDTPFIVVTGNNLSHAPSFTGAWTGPYKLETGNAVWQ